MKEDHLVGFERAIVALMAYAVGVVAATAVFSNPILTVDLARICVLCRRREL